MKNNLIKIVFLLSILIIASCTDLLEVEPQQSISQNTAVGTEDNLNKLVVGLYQTDGNAYSHGGYIQIFSDLLGSTDQVIWNGTFFEPREALTKTMNANNFLIDQMWKSLYKTIGQCNLVLDNLSVIKTESEKARLEGEARFLRAFSYFELVRLFGNSTKGVPLRLKSIEAYDADLSIARSATDDVYKAIIDDVTKAVSLLPEENSFYADKYAAVSLLSRINLYLGKYAEALEASNMVINKSGRTLAGNYSQAFNNDINGAEDIFAMQVTSQSGENQLISMYASQENGGRGGDISLTDSFLSIFDDMNDQRASFYYENNFGDLLTNKYTNQFGNVPVIRLAELYLIRAECNQRLGSNLGATPQDDINAIRQRSGAPAIGAPSLNDILYERDRELAFEGFAIYDIKRNQKSIGGLEFSSPKLVMPIPQSEMDSNKLMEQNEGY